MDSSTRTSTPTHSIRHPVSTSTEAQSDPATRPPPPPPPPSLPPPPHPHPPQSSAAVSCTQSQKTPNSTDEGGRRRGGEGFVSRGEPSPPPRSPLPPPTPPPPRPSHHLPPRITSDKLGQEEATRRPHSLARLPRQPTDGHTHIRPGRERRTGRTTGRALHSSTSQLNLSRV